MSRHALLQAAALLSRRAAVSSAGPASQQACISNAILFWDALEPKHAHGCAPWGSQSAKPGLLASFHSLLLPQRQQQQLGPQLACSSLGIRALHQSALQASSGDKTSTSTSSISSSTEAQAQKAEELWNLPNSLSIARGVSGPFIAYLIIQEQWPLAVTAVVVSGATDWLDGYLARRMGLQSVLGSYLDPLGDKALICSVAAALAWKGMVPVWVAAVVVGRDVALVSGVVLHRWRSLGWRTDLTMQEFMKTQGAAGAPQGSAAASAGGSSSGGGSEPSGQASAAADGAGGVEGQDGSCGEAASLGKVDAGVPLMRPLFISKANTVMQLALVGSCMGQAWVAWPDPASLHMLEVATAVTTGASCVAYAHKYATGKLL